MSRKHKIQSKEEETANWLTHAAGVLLIVIFFPMLIGKAMDQGSNGVVWGVIIFGFGSLMAYLASTLYHYVKNETLKRKLRVWDHIGIFMLIGGTYAPIVLQYTKMETAAYFLGVMWSIILVGSILKLFFTGKYEKVSVVLYLFLGWMLVFIYQPIQENMPMEIFWWILGGGLSYTTGVIFYRWEALKYQHSIWHLFVLAGTSFHFIAIYKSVF